LLRSTLSILTGEFLPQSARKLINHNVSTLVGAQNFTKISNLFTRYSSFLNQFKVNK